MTEENKSEPRPVAWKRNSATPKIQGYSSWPGPYRFKKRSAYRATPALDRARVLDTEKFYGYWYSHRARFGGWLHGLIYPRKRRLVEWFYRNGTPERYEREWDDRFDEFVECCAMGIVWGGIALCLIGVVIRGGW